MRILTRQALTKALIALTYFRRWVFGLSELEDIWGSGAGRPMNFHLVLQQSFVMKTKLTLRTVTGCHCSWGGEMKLQIYLV